MPFITIELLRRRAEHNEGLLSTLEEISLHQEELEEVGDLLGTTCRKLKILYLQNNIISKMEGFHHLKDLQYLNLALNNITKIEGLSKCEFLNKLDLTVNFIDLDTFSSSIDHLAKYCTTLKDIYIMGNPITMNWNEFYDPAAALPGSNTSPSNSKEKDQEKKKNLPKYAKYIIAKLPNLETLDGEIISKSMRILSERELPKLEKELQILGEAKALEKLINKEKPKVEVLDDNEMTENTPEVRTQIYKELAAQKKEKEDRQKENLPKDRDYELEQEKKKQEIREKEKNTDEKEILQKNEGGWEFSWDEESTKGCIILEVPVGKFLDSSLIDVDLHPTYVSIVIKSKLLRLKIPCEINVSKSKCQRSKASGNLVVIMSKVNPNENVIEFKTKDKKPSKINNDKNEQEKNSRVRYKKKDEEPSLLELMMQESSLNTKSNSLKDDALKSDFTLKFVKGDTDESVDTSLLELNSNDNSKFSSKIMELD